MTPMKINPENEYEVAGAAVAIVKTLSPEARQKWLWYGMGMTAACEGVKESDESAPDDTKRR